ncbi:LysR substrate-binding domain-containing protein [Streptomyces sp. NPDC001902]
MAGAPPLAAGARTARALARLRELRPRARVTLRELDRAEVVTGVAAGGLDVGLVDGAASGDRLRLRLRLPEAGPLHAVRCAEADLTVVLAEDHPPAPPAPPAGSAAGRTSRTPCGSTRRPPRCHRRCCIRRRPGGLPGGRAARGARGLDGDSSGRDSVRRCCRAPRPQGAPGVAVVPLTAPRLVRRTEVLHRGGAGGAARVLTGLLTRAPGPQRPTGLTRSAQCLLPRPGDGRTVEGRRYLGAPSPRGGRGGPPGDRPGTRARRPLPRDSRAAPCDRTARPGPTPPS